MTKTDTCNEVRRAQEDDRPVLWFDVAALVVS